MSKLSLYEEIRPKGHNLVRKMATIGDTGDGSWKKNDRILQRRQVSKTIFACFNRIFLQLMEYSVVGSASTCWRVSASVNTDDFDQFCSTGSFTSIDFDDDY